MQLMARVTLVLSLLCVLSVRAHAEGDALYYHEPAPGAAIGAAFINVVALPARLVATTFFGVLGGFTGFMTGGDGQAAWDVWNVAGGDQFFTPGMLQRHENYRFSSSDPRPH